MPADELAETPTYGVKGPTARLTDASTLTVPTQRSNGDTSDPMLGLTETDTGHRAPCFRTAILVSTPPIPYFARGSNAPHAPMSTRSLTPNRATICGYDMDRPTRRSPL